MKTKQLIHRHEVCIEILQAILRNEKRVLELEHDLKYYRKNYYVIKRNEIDLEVAKRTIRILKIRYDKQNKDFIDDVLRRYIGYL
jgi:succinate dehydrogenase/fumarate reductase flavoprotein subunit